MTSELLFGLGTAFWLGLLTSISPCPLATNIAAISYVGRRVGRTQSVIAAGLLYTLGRTLTYVAIGILLVMSLLSAPAISVFLQKYMNKLLGPILIVAGMFLLDLLKTNSSGKGVSEGLQARVDRAGIWGALILGVLFSLSFCPVSAALFFGSLIPLAVQHESGILLPTSYGVATGVPVLIFAFLIAAGTKQIGVAFNKLQSFEVWARKITGAVFILVGMYMALRYVFGVDL